ncbi:MAG TPA: translation initiation factor IF-2 [Candidatus Cloacimonas sp.]|nr:translation initiation factor IF-2 [Candidatus Cloacimonadota bacterium]HPH71039.1 translation initiation factor IF-2 [Candidatus Cloacimonas sp.]HPZ01369.1 translation initiation factor IF-2 [Candidatus Cloacimonas sp.]HQB49575.1 translation initiation factor IF-2 [Candidatus Cloacimonas sp.]HQM16648.1 translation initiation factor IF-2 [Candidatus Cloacimonas sp.]
MTIRVYDLAKELKISTMALKKHLTDLGVNVKSHMSLIDEEVADKIRIKYKEQVDAEKRAERDRKRLIEMRQAAKAKQETPEPEAKKEPEIIAPVVEQITIVPEPEEVKPIAEPEKKVSKPVQEKAEERTVKPAPQKEKPVSPPKYSKPSKPEVVAPKPSTLHKKDAGKTEQYKHKPSAEKGTKPVVVAPVPEPIKEVEERKFGKAKVSHEELGEKSKHKKAIISSSKKAKQKIVDVIEIDEAEISRNIKKTLQKSSKRKKYHREAQTVEERSNEIVIREFTSVSELAKIMNVAPSEIISKFFMMGQLVTMNQRLDKDSLEMICDEFKVDFRFEDEYGMDIIGRELEQYSEVKEERRPPVVTIMGHVDHGKTSILDYIRNENIVAGESGGITQHIGAYQIEINKHKITFIDTPGHEAFTAMRARGANVTDIAVIVVAATEGVKAQTREAIDHAKAAGVSIIIAINKVDLPEANVDKVISQLLDMGIYLEQYGGDIPWCRTSVVTGEGILNLIELILLTAEIMELKAKREVPASAVVIEAGMDTRMGPSATILMQEGTLRKGDIVVCGAVHGRIRKMENERGAEIKVIYPSDVARIYGLSDTPKAGDILNQVDSEKTARSISSERQQIRLEREKYLNKSSLQNIFARIKEEKINSLNVILKTDTDGSSEALADSFQKLSNEEVSVNIIHKSVGGINEADVSLAAASDAIIIGFNVRASSQVRKFAEDEGVQIKIYQVIYDAIEDLHNALEGMLQPEFEEQVIGSALVKQVFKIKKVGTIAGCQVDKGIIQANCKVRLYRNDVLVTEDTISSLKHYADDVNEVRAGSECGISLANFSDIKEGDILEAFVINEISKKL